MPIYEYRCQSCGEASSHFFRSVSSVSEPKCPACGSESLARLVSKTYYMKGDAARLAELDTSRILGNMDSKDVAGFEQWARRTGEQYDSALGTNFRELADKTTAGEDPIQRVDP